MQIEEIDNDDFAALFLSTIEDDTGHFDSYLSEELYDVLISIGINDEQIYNSSSNHLNMLKRLEDIFKERNDPNIKPLVGWTFQDIGSSKSYVDYTALVKYNNNIYPERYSTSFGPNEYFKDEEAAFMRFIKHIESDILIG